MEQVVHEPRCNTYCRPGQHHLTSGIGFPHIHQTDLTAECGECVTPPDRPPRPGAAPVTAVEPQTGLSEKEHCG